MTGSACSSVQRASSQRRTKYSIITISDDVDGDGEDESDSEWAEAAAEAAVVEDDAVESDDESPVAAGDDNDADDVDDADEGDDEDKSCSSDCRRASASCIGV